MSVKKLDQVKREYFQGQLGVSYDSLYDLEKNYLNGLGFANSDLIPDLERAFLQDALGVSIFDLSTLWELYWNELGVPAGRFDERMWTFYVGYGFEPDQAMLTEDGSYIVLEDGTNHLLYR